MIKQSIQSIAARVYRTLADWFFRKPVETAAEEKPKPTKKRQPRKDADEIRDSGQFYFREAILDDLDTYFKLMRIMKKADPDAYNLYKQVGALVLPRSSGVYLQEKGKYKVQPWFTKTQPSFGAVALFWDGQDEEDEVTPRFMYFNKIKPTNSKTIFQPTSDPVYEVVIFYTLDGKGLPCNMFVSILPDGTLRPLKCRAPVYETVRAKKRSSKYDCKRGNTFQVPVSGWHYPEAAKDIAKHNKISTVDAIQDIFVFAANLFETTSAAQTRVEVTKGGTVAVFGVDIKRTPYFFADRDVTIGETGNRRRIFHVVRPHKRVLPDGREIYIKMHFRGEKQFLWNGYSVRITIPGRDHIAISELNVAGQLIPYEDEHLSENHLSPKEFGQYLRERILDRPLH